GAGGKPSALTSFFACYSVSGHDPGQTVDVDVTDQSPVVASDRSNVRIGAASLACAIVKVFVHQPAGRVLAEPDPTQHGETAFNAIKCYSVTGPGGTNLPQGPTGLPYQASDAILGILGTLEEPLPPPAPQPPPGATPGSLGTEQGIQVSQLRYIC